MRPLPLRTVLLASDPPPAELAGLLGRAIGEDPGRPFAGTVTDGGFVITRLRDYRSTFMPVIRGALSPGREGGTRVELRLTPPGVVVVFMAIWLGFLAAVGALIVASRAVGGGRSLIWLLAPAGLGGLSWGVMVSVFSADARWAVENLLERVPALRRAVNPGTSRGDAHLW